jgi:hypothetical protein
MTEMEPKVHFKRENPKYHLPVGAHIIFKKDENGNIYGSEYLSSITVRKQINTLGQVVYALKVPAVAKNRPRRR